MEVIPMFEDNRLGMEIKLARFCNRVFTFDSALSITVRLHEFDEEMDQIEDADNSIPSLSYELEDLILARLPRAEYWKLSFLNRRCLALVKSGELFKIRKEIGFQEPSIFMLPSGENTWWTFDRKFKSCKKLPEIPADPLFRYGHKESFCAGSQLLVSGFGVDGQVIWRYEQATNQWEKGPCMQTPRTLFASATWGNSVFVAGGIDETNDQVYDTAEKYNSDTKSWQTLPRMNRKRKLSAGCFMDNKFYVIGGRNEDGELTCGEYFDEINNRWELIPDMVKENPVKIGHSSPLLAVVNDELYSLEARSNELKVYSKKTNSWKPLGRVPVKADTHKGQGVAFKSLGNELLIIGASLSSPSSMSAYTCQPKPNASEELHWRGLDSGRNWFSHFILSCSIMTV